MIMKKDLGFRGFHDIQDNQRVLPEESQTGFIQNLMPGERGTQANIFVFWKDVLFYNILKERKQTSLANAFLKERICFS